MKNDTKFEEELTCRFKIDILIGSLWPKYILLELQKYRGVIFHYTEEFCKFWRKADLWFQKWHEKFGKFVPEHLKGSKLGLGWYPFVQSRKVMTLEFTEKLCVRSYVLLGQSFERRAYWLTFCFQGYHGIPIPTQAKKIEDSEHLAND